MAIKLLEPAVRSRLRSGFAITSVSQCVGELVENSIDAGATCVAVRIDVVKFKVQVVDNGEGISIDDICFIGERYMTSKCHTVEDVNSKLNFFGYRGEAIASIVDVSGTVEICSRHKLSQQTYSKLFHNGKALPVTASKSHRPSVGTMTTIHDFFYNMPVRRKGLSALLELEQVKRAVESIALVHPSVSFSVRNDATGECVLQTHKTSSMLVRFGLLFGRDKTMGMKDVSSSQTQFELSGFISVDGHHNKSLQFIYVNSRIVKKTPLHTCVNNLLANSLIARKPSKAADLIWQKDDQECSSEYSGARHMSDTFGMYVLQVKCLRSEYDICLEPAKTLIEFKDWDGIVSAIEGLVRDFLVNNNLTLAPANPAVVFPASETTSTVDKKEMGPQVQEIDFVDDIALDPFLQSRSIKHSDKFMKSLNPLEHSSYTDKLCKTADEHSCLPQMKVPDSITGKILKHKTEVDTGLESTQAHIQVSSTEYRRAQNQVTEVLPSSIQSEVGQQCLECCDKPIGHLTNAELLVGCGTCNNTVCKKSTIVNCSEATGPESKAKSCLQFQSSSSLIKPHYYSSLSRSNSNQLHHASCVRKTEVGVGLQVNSLQVDNTYSSAFPTVESLLKQDKHLASASYRSPLRSSSVSSKLSKLIKDNSRKSSHSNSWCGKRSHSPQHSALDTLTSRLCVAQALQLEQSDSIRSTVSLHPDADSTKLTCADYKDKSSSRVTSECSSTLYACASDCGVGIKQHVLTSDHIQSHLLPVSMFVSETQKSPLKRDRQSSLLSTSVNLNSMESSMSVHDTSVSGTLSSQGLGHALISTMVDSRDNRVCESKLSLNSLPLSGIDADTATVHLPQHEYNSCTSNTSIGSVTDSNTTSQRTASTSDTRHHSRTSELSSSALTMTEWYDRTVWKKVLDPTSSRVLYMNSKSGHCVSSLPKVNVSTPSTNTEPCANMLYKNSDSMDDRSGDSVSTTACLSLHATDGYADAVLQKHSQIDHPHYSFEEIPPAKYHSCGGSETEGQSFTDILKGWENPAFQGGEQGIFIGNNVKQSKVKVHNIISRYKFSQEMFSHMKVLGQVDNKFIACMLDSQNTGEKLHEFMTGSPDLLVMIDQHAAHERIKLENLLNELYVTPQKETTSSMSVLEHRIIKSSRISPPLVIKLQPSELNLVRLFHQHFKQNGLSLVVNGDDQVLVTSLPSVFMEREASEVRRGRPTVALSIIKDMIVKETELLQATCGGASGIPETILKVLSSQACHGAIKFGDVLTQTECQALILALSHCNLPFQCAHGRPSVVPILDLHILNKRFPTFQVTQFPSLRDLLDRIG